MEICGEGHMESLFLFISFSGQLMPLNYANKACSDAILTPASVKHREMEAVACAV